MSVRRAFLTVRSWSSVARWGVLPLASLLALGTFSGCALVLGFQDTSLVDGADGGTDSGGPAVDDGGNGSEPDANDETPALRITPKQVTLRRGGGSVSVALQLTRGLTVTGDVAIQVTGLPDGVTAAPVSLAGGESTGTLTLTASASAALGKVTASLTTNADAIPPVPLSVIVSEASGTPDPKFGVSGIASDTTGGKGAFFYALAIQADDAVLAGGVTGTAGWLLRRYAANGAVDATFSPVLPMTGKLQALAVDGSGRVLCAGFSSLTPADPQQLSMLRILPNGSIDTAFGGGLIRLDAADATLGSAGLGVAVGKDDSVWVAGVRQETGGKLSGILAHYTSAGALDPAFNGGKLLFDPNHRIVGVTGDATGGVVFGGTEIAADGTNSFYLSHRTASGPVDPTFGTAGVLVFGRGFEAKAFARTESGAYALAGTASGGTRYVAGEASSVGVPIWARGVVNGTSVSYFGMAVQGDGRLVVTGHSGSKTGEARVDRLMPDGTRDDSFGTGGSTILRPNGANAFDMELFAAAVQASGRVLVAGNQSDKGAVIYGLRP